MTKDAAIQTAVGQDKDLASRPFAGLKMLMIGNYAGTSIRLLLKALSNLLRNHPKKLFWISTQQRTRFIFMVVIKSDRLFTMEFVIV